MSHFSLGLFIAKAMEIDPSLDRYLFKNHFNNTKTGVYTYFPRTADRSYLSDLEGHRNRHIIDAYTSPVMLYDKYNDYNDHIFKQPDVMAYTVLKTHRTTPENRFHTCIADTTYDTETNRLIIDFIRKYSDASYYPTNKDLITSMTFDAPDLTHFVTRVKETALSTSMGYYYTTRHCDYTNPLSEELWSSTIYNWISFYCSILNNLITALYVESDTITIDIIKELLQESCLPQPTDYLTDPRIATSLIKHGGLDIKNAKNKSNANITIMLPLVGKLKSSSIHQPIFLLLYYLLYQSDTEVNNTLSTYLSDVVIKPTKEPCNLALMYYALVTLSLQDNLPVNRLYQITQQFDTIDHKTVLLSSHVSIRQRLIAAGLPIPSNGLLFKETVVNEMDNDHIEKAIRNRWHAYTRPLATSDMNTNETTPVCVKITLDTARNLM